MALSRLLIIEDDEDHAHLMRRALKKAIPHCEVIWHSNFKSGCEELSCGAFDLILLDHNLPDASGLEALGWIRNRNHTAPVIMVYSAGSEGIATQALEMGAVDYIIKQRNYFELLPVVVKQNMEKHKLHQRVRDLEAELQNKALEFVEKNKEMENFIYLISHDLKSPLVSIQGFCSELVREYKDLLGEGGHFYLTRIAANATEIEHRILQLLELSRVGRMETTPEPVDASGLLKEVLSHMDPRMRQRGIEVLVPEGAFEVVVNRTRLKQVFTNLLDNAVRYMGDAERPRIEIRFDALSDAWQFFVKDNGIGIAKEHQNKIFNVFERLPDGKAAHPKGIGMGLAIVKKIVDVHGGRIWVESESGKGSTFHISIPRKAQNWQMRLET